jgi:hypothetical protein
MTTLSDILGAASNQIKTGLGGVLEQVGQGNIPDSVSAAENSARNFLSNIRARGAAAFGDAARGMAARGDAMQTWSWYCILPPVADKQSVQFNSGSSFGDIANSISLPWYYVEEAFLPQRSISEMQTERNGHNIKYAESYAIGDLTLKFFMDDENRAHQYLTAWASNILKPSDPAILSNQGVWGMPVSYKKDITIVIASVAKDVLLTYKYIGCFPKEPTSLQLNSNASERLIQEVIFAVDDVQVLVQNTKGILDNLADTAQGYALSALGNFTDVAVGDAIASFKQSLS